LAAHAVLGELAKHGKRIVIMNFALGLLLIAVLNIAIRVL
jgi:hypothetical protein